MIAFGLGHGMKLVRVLRARHVEEIEDAARKLRARLRGAGVRLFLWRRLALCMSCEADCNNHQNTRITAHSDGHFPAFHFPAFHCWHLRAEGPLTEAGRTSRFHIKADTRSQLIKVPASAPVRRRYRLQDTSTVGNRAANSTWGRVRQNRIK